MLSLDEALTRAINQPAGSIPVLDALMVPVTSLGVPLMVFLLVIQWWLGPNGRNREHLRHVIVAAALSSALGFILNQLILLFLHRMRPYDAGVTHLLVSPSSEPSFPSDHATVAIAIPMALWLHGEQRRAVPFALLALLVAVSRIYVGTHYFGDVVGGAGTAVIAAFLVRAAYREGTRLDRAITSLL